MIEVMMSDCPTFNRQKVVKKGFCLHSTGANNPKLKRYVQPDMHGIGENIHMNSWNNPSMQKSVTWFVGMLDNGAVECVQVQPLNCICWHAGRTEANRDYVACEMCEDDLLSYPYFRACIDKAVEACVYTLKHLGIKEVTPETVTSHYELYKQFRASAHIDPINWFGYHGYSMDKFREEVKRRMSGNKSAWYDPYMEKAEKLGLLTNERGGDPVTRGEAAVMLLKLYQLLGGENK